MDASSIADLCRSHLELERSGRSEHATSQRARCDAQLRELAAANSDASFDASLAIADLLRGRGEPAEGARVLDVVLAAWAVSDVEGRAILRNSQAVALSEAGDRRAIGVLEQLVDELSRQRHSGLLTVQLNLVNVLLCLREPERALGAAQRALEDASSEQRPQVRRVIADIEAAIAGEPASPSRLDVTGLEWDQDEGNDVMIFVPVAAAAQLATVARRLASDRAVFVLADPAERDSAMRWVSEATEDGFYFGDDNGLVIDLRPSTLERLATELERRSRTEIDVCPEIRLVVLQP